MQLETHYKNFKKKKREDLVPHSVALTGVEFAALYVDQAGLRFPEIRLALLYKMKASPHPT